MSNRAFEASMLIRRPPGEVFAAFVNPMTLRKFWLTDASGPLAPGARVKWKFMVPGAEDDVIVRRFESPNHLAFDWSDGIHVEMTFALIDSRRDARQRHGQRFQRGRNPRAGDGHHRRLQHRAV